MKTITAQHVENGTMMKRIVEDDILKGISFEDSVASLAKFLEIDVESVKLGIAIANGERLRNHNAAVQAYYAELR